MAELTNPFAPGERTAAEIAADANENSLKALRSIYRRCRTTLAALERSAPESPLHLSWIDKVGAARDDYLRVAQSLGHSEAEARAALEETPE